MQRINLLSAGEGTEDGFTEGLKSQDRSKDNRQVWRSSFLKAGNRPCRSETLIRSVSGFCGYGSLRLKHLKLRGSGFHYKVMIKIK